MQHTPTPTPPRHASSPTPSLLFRRSLFSYSSLSPPALHLSPEFLVRTFQLWQVRAVTFCDCYELLSADFQSICNDHPEDCERVYTAMDLSLQSAVDDMQKKGRNNTAKARRESESPHIANLATLEGLRALLHVASVAGSRDRC